MLPSSLEGARKVDTVRVQRALKPQKAYELASDSSHARKSRHKPLKTKSRECPPPQSPRFHKASDGEDGKVDETSTIPAVPAISQSFRRPQSKLFELFLESPQSPRFHKASDGKGAQFAFYEAHPRSCLLYTSPSPRDRG